ncbi:MAG: CDP-alcohol phosphatidyltransferase family protein [Patescibacteria group bacterium]
MRIFNRFVSEHRELFRFLPADVVHPHDHLMARTFLRIIPDSITPNQVTAFRLLFTPIIFFLLLIGAYGLGMLCFVIAAATDAIDGSLARTTNRITKFGMMFDPLADKLLIGSMVLLLVFRYLNVWLGLTILLVEIVFIIIAAVSHVKFKTVRMANIWGKMKMMLQVIAMCATLLAIVFQFPFLFTIASALFGVAVGCALISLFSHGI